MQKLINKFISFWFIKVIRLEKDSKYVLVLPKSAGLRPEDIQGIMGMLKDEGIDVIGSIHVHSPRDIEIIEKHI